MPKQVFWENVRSAIMHGWPRFAVKYLRKCVFGKMYVWKKVAFLTLGLFGLSAGSVLGMKIYDMAAQLNQISVQLPTSMIIVATGVVVYFAASFFLGGIAVVHIYTEGTNIWYDCMGETDLWSLSLNMALGILLGSVIPMIHVL